MNFQGRHSRLVGISWYFPVCVCVQGVSCPRRIFYFPYKAVMMVFCDGLTDAGSLYLPTEAKKRVKHKLCLILILLLGAALTPAAFVSLPLLLDGQRGLAPNIWRQSTSLRGGNFTIFVLQMQSHTNHNNKDCIIGIRAVFSSSLSPWCWSHTFLVGKIYQIRLLMLWGVKHD